MFMVEQRQRVRMALLERAREDERIVGAAITGSAARDAEDRWSDVDLFFGVADSIAVEETLGDWSAFMYRELGAIHHLDLHAGPAIYRAFLLGELLEIDLGFTRAAEFGPLGTGGFSVVFGDAAQRQPRSVDPGHLIGLAWHHVLRARISVERGALWQAEYCISSVRDHTLALACHRLGHPVAHAKGADNLPAAVTERVQEALVRTLEAGEVLRALRAATGALLCELRDSDSELAEILEQPLLEMADIS
jgi:predicted nucleotidyltransferase